jgi:hypothetical protein
MDNIQRHNICIEWSSLKISHCETTEKSNGILGSLGIDAKVNDHIYWLNHLLYHKFQGHLQNTYSIIILIKSAKNPIYATSFSVLSIYYSPKIVSVPVTVAERYEACTVFVRSEAGIVVLNPTQGMDVKCLCMCVRFSVFV